MTKMTDDLAPGVRALFALDEHGVSEEVQQLLVVGDPALGVSAGALDAVMETATRTNADIEMGFTWHMGEAAEKDGRFRDAVHFFKEAIEAANTLIARRQAEIGEFARDVALLEEAFNRCEVRVDSPVEDE